MSRSIRDRKRDFGVILEALEGIYGHVVNGSNGVHSKRSPGSTSPDSVKKFIAGEEKWLRSAYRELLKK